METIFTRPLDNAALLVIVIITAMVTAQYHIWRNALGIAAFFKMATKSDTTPLTEVVKDMEEENGEEDEAADQAPKSTQDSKEDQ